MCPFILGLLGKLGEVKRGIIYFKSISSHAKIDRDVMGANGPLDFRWEAKKSFHQVEFSPGKCWNDIPKNRAIVLFLWIIYIFHLLYIILSCLVHLITYTFNWLRKYGYSVVVIIYYLENNLAFPLKYYFFFLCFLLRLFPKAMMVPHQSMLILLYMMITMMMLFWKLGYVAISFPSPKCLPIYQLS